MVNKGGNVESAITTVVQEKRIERKRNIGRLVMEDTVVSQKNHDMLRRLLSQGQSPRAG